MLMPQGALDADVVLRDGSTLRLRAATPDDLAAVCDLYARLSVESLRRRFGGMHHPDVAELSAVCAACGDDRLTLVGVRGARIVGVVQYARRPERPTHADIAFVVDDELQGLGAGTRMLEQLSV